MVPGGEAVPSPVRHQPKEQPSLDFFDLITEVIDLRSFSNLWYWIVLAIMWSTLSHWTMGVPFHVVQRARNGHAESQADMEKLAEINVRRLVAFAQVSGPVLVGGAAFVLTGLAVLGWVYGVEFCQAVFLLVLPAMLVGALSVRRAFRLAQGRDPDLIRALRTHRIQVQMMGVFFIFITAFWGMYANVTVGPLL
jgi:hypothetical protein